MSLMSVSFSKQIQPASCILLRGLVRSKGMPIAKRRFSKGGLLQCWRRKWFNPCHRCIFWWFSEVEKTWSHCPPATTGRFLQRLHTYFQTDHQTETTKMLTVVSSPDVSGMIFFCKLQLFIFLCFKNLVLMIVFNKSKSTTVKKD